MICVECGQPVDVRTGFCAPCGLWALDTSSLPEDFRYPTAEEGLGAAGGAYASAPPPLSQDPVETSPFVQVTLATAPPPRVRIQGKPLAGGSTAKGALPSKASQGMAAEGKAVESLPFESMPAPDMPIQAVPDVEPPVAEVPPVAIPEPWAPTYAAPVEEVPVPAAPAYEAPIYEAPTEPVVPESVPVTAAPSSLAKAAAPSTAMFWPPPRASDRANPVVPTGYYVNTEFDEDIEHTRVSNRRSNPKFWTLSLPTGEVEVIVGSVIIGRAASPLPGRAGARLLSIEDPTKSVSKNHAIFTDVGGALFVEDLESMNGVVVTLSDGTESDLFAGQRLRLEHGAVVELGDMRVSVEQH